MSQRDTRVRPEFDHLSVSPFTHRFSNVKSHLRRPPPPFPPRALSRRPRLGATRLRLDSARKKKDSGQFWIADKPLDADRAIGQHEEGQQSVQHHTTNFVLPYVEKYKHDETTTRHTHTYTLPTFFLACLLVYASGTVCYGNLRPSRGLVQTSHAPCVGVHCVCRRYLAATPGPIGIVVCVHANRNCSCWPLDDTKFPHLARARSTSLSIRLMVPRSQGTRVPWIIAPKQNTMSPQCFGPREAPHRRKSAQAGRIAQIERSCASGSGRRTQKTFGECLGAPLCVCVGVFCDSTGETETYDDRLCENPDRKMWYGL